MSSTHENTTVVFDNFAFPLAVDETVLLDETGNISKFKKNTHHLQKGDSVII